MIDKWLKDDHTYMQSQNPLRLGLDSRGARRTGSSSATCAAARSWVGPGTVMGAGETQLMHTLTTAAKKGWAYMEDDARRTAQRGGEDENG